MKGIMMDLIVIKNLPSNVVASEKREDAILIFRDLLLEFENSEASFVRVDYSNEEFESITAAERSLRMSIRNSKLTNIGCRIINHDIYLMKFA